MVHCSLSPGQVHKNPRGNNDVHVKLQTASAVLCRWKVDIVDVRSLHDTVLDIVLKLPRIVLHLLCSLLVERVVRIGVLHMTVHLIEL